MSIRYRLRPQQGLASDDSVRDCSVDDTRSDLRSRLGPVEQFTSEQDGAVTDFFVDLGVQVTYGPGEAAQLIEVAWPAQVTYDGTELLGAQREELLAVFRAADLEVFDAESVLDVPDLGVAVFFDGDASVALLLGDPGI